MTRRVWLGNLVLVVLGLAVALAAGELAVRLVPPLAHRVATLRAVAERRVEVHPRGLYRMEDASFWTLTPGFAGRFVRPYFDIEVRANRLGLRDRDPWPKPPGAFRVLGLGDSFAFGWGVPLDRCFFKQLEVRLDRSHPAVRHEVVNAGIPGYGTWEALRLLKSVGPAYDPDLVILAFYEGNDYLNNAEAPRRRAVVDGYLTDLDRPGAGVLARHSALLTLAATQWSGIREKRAFRASVEKTKRLLSEMRTALEMRGVPLVVVFIPDQDSQAYARPALLRVSDRLLRGEDVFLQRRELADFCRGQGIGFCRLSRRFEDAAGAGSLRLSPDDTHLNAEGHRLAAEEIHAWLEANPWTLRERIPGPSGSP